MYWCILCLVHDIPTGQRERFNYNAIFLLNPISKRNPLQINVTLANEWNAIISLLSTITRKNHSGDYYYYVSGSGYALYWILYSTGTEREQ